MKNKSILLKLTALILACAAVMMCLAGCQILAEFGLVEIDPPEENHEGVPEEPTEKTPVEYTIVYDVEGLDYNKRAAEYIQLKIKEYLNKDVKIIDDSEAKKLEYVIVVGETSLPISKSLNANCEGFEFALKSENGKIALEGDYFVIAAAAYYFVNNYVKGKSEINVPNQNVVRSPIVTEANNFIVLIGDGMGEMHTKLYEAYDVATEGDTAFSDGEDFFYGYLFPYLGESRTRSLTGTTDSAAGGTALSTGYKTYNGVVGRDKDGNDVMSLTELAASLGKATAVMSTDKNKGATPAAFSAHADHRNNDEEILASQELLSENCGTIIDCHYFDDLDVNKTTKIENFITNTLSKIVSDEDGFFIMYEEAWIDKYASAGDLEQTFLSVVRFNQAIALFMEYAFYNPDTFVLITADHETGGLSIEDGTASFATDDHTMANVPVFAYGYGSEVFDGQEVENIQIAKTIAALMGVAEFGDPTTDGSLIEVQ